MDGSGLMESLLNSIKPLPVAVASLTVKLQIFANSTKLSKLQINFVKGEISNLIKHRAISLENKDSRV